MLWSENFDQVGTGRGEDAGIVKRANKGRKKDETRRIGSYGNNRATPHSSGEQPSVYSLQPIKMAPLDQLLSKTSLLESKPSKTSRRHHSTGKTNTNARKTDDVPQKWQKYCTRRESNPRPSRSKSYRISSMRYQLRHWSPSKNRGNNSNLNTIFGGE